MRAVTLLMFFLLACSEKVNACSTYLSIHDIISAEGGVMAIDDELGVREIKASVYSVGACVQSPSFPSGVQFVGNYTLMGLSSTVGSRQCVIKEIAGKRVLDSMQAIVVETNGWLIEPQSIDLDDIDSQVNVPMKSAWMEAVAIFGVLKGDVVVPKTRVSPNSLVTPVEYIVTKDAMTAMSLSIGETSVPGGEFTSNHLFNCPFARDHPDSSLCRISAMFDSAVDKLVFLYALKQQSLYQADSAVFLSQIDMKCGCRCVSGNVGTKEIALPIQDAPGLCTKVETRAPRIECDVLGKKWCSMENSFAYKINGTKLSDSRYPCYAEASFSARILSDFAPLNSFVPAI